MSTKTSIKRIALVAVSALGFGLLSVMPAKAAAGSAAGDDLTLYSGQTITITVTDADLTAADVIATLGVTVASSNPAVTLGAVTVGDGTGATDFTAAFTVTSTPGTLQSTNITVTYDEDQTGATSNDTATLSSVAVGATVTAISLAGPVRAGSGQAVNVLMQGSGVINNAAANTNVFQTTITAAGTATFTPAADAALTLSSSGVTIGTLAVNTAGSYSLVYAWDGGTNNDVADANEPQGTLTFTTTGVPTSFTLTPASASQAAGTAQEYVVTLLDANGAATQSVSGEFFPITADPSSATSAVSITNGVTGRNRILLRRRRIRK